MKKFFKVQIVILIIGVLMTYNSIGLASSKTDLQNEKNDLNNSISEAEEELNNIEKEKSQTLNEVENLMGQISDYQSELDDLESQITDLESKISEAETEIKKDEEKYERERKALNERLVTIYESGDTSYLDILLSSNGLSDFISSYYLVSELATYDTEMLEQIEKEKQKIENEKQELENNKSSLDNAKKTKEAKSNALKVAKKEKEQKASELSEEEKQTQKEIEEMLEDKAKIEQELQKLAKQEEERIAKAKKEAEEAAKKKNNSSSVNTSDSVVTTNPSSSGYIFPVKGCNKSSINNTKFPSYSGHTGVDINRGVTGKSVVAVKDGTVITSTAMKNSDGSYRSYGEYVTIAHNDGTVTVYAHMLAGSRTVSKNDKVTQGQVIGTVGSTGNSTGTHLHFEVRVYKSGKYVAVNPIPYLP